MRRFWQSWPGRVLCAYLGHGGGVLICPRCGEPKDPKWGGRTPLRLVLV